MEDFYGEKIETKISKFFPDFFQKNIFPGFVFEKKATEGMIDIPLFC